MRLWKRSVRQEDVLMRVGNGLKRRNKNGGSGMIRHSGRKFKLMILGLAIMLGLGGTALMFPQTVSADGAETYSKGYYKIYIDKDCFDKSIDGIYLPGVHYCYCLSNKYTDRCFVGSNPGWTWMWLCDGGTDYDFIINTPDGKDPNGVLSMEAGNANLDVNADNPKIGKCEVNPESLNRFDREDYPNENYYGSWSFKFHGGSREYQSMTSDWNLHITRSNARLTFNSLTNEELTWDIPGDYTSAPNYEKSDSTNKVRSFAVKKGTYTLPGAKRDGYILTAWYKVDPYVKKKVKITDENVKIAGKLAGRPGERIAVDSSMDYYAYFDPIPNTATITLTNDDAPWTDTWVELYQGGNCYYTLNHTGNGVYKNNRVKNGTYDVYVRGIDTGKNITLKAVDTSVEEKMTIDFYTAKFTVMLDDAMSSKPGELTLRSGGVTYYTVPTKSSQDGSYEYYLLRDEAYDIFINGEDTGCDVSNDKREHTMEYYTVQVKVTDDTAWTNANIELRDTNGMVKAKLDKGNASGKSVTYEKILRKDVNTTYIIYAEGHDTHATVKATADDKMAELTFYTAKIDVTCSDKNKKVNMYLKNKLASYSMSAGEGAVNRRTYTCPHLLKTMNGSYELQYHLEVTGAFIGDPCTIASTDKVKSLELYVITYKWYVNDRFGTIESTDHDKHYVFRNGYDSASAEPNISGFAFAGWGTAKQTSKDEKSYTAFDYAKTKITKDITLYPHYMSPTVEIMGYVRDNGNGTLSATGSSFRLANISISGFELGDQSIKYVLFTTNGVKSVKVNGTNNNITWNDKLSTLTFGNSVSMAYAQEFVRKNVIFTPENGKTSTVMVTVMDKNGNASGTTDKYSPTPGDFSGVTGWTNLANVGTGATLNSGYYYLVSNANFSNNSYGGNGLRIADGAEVTIYIRPGITLTCQGGQGSGPHTGGGAGIYLPANSKLYFMGGGTVNATGGRGADGAQGGRGGDAGKGSGDNVNTGSGGRGGDGGAGAGAGIGTNGGAGGYWTGEGDSSGEGGAGKSCDKDKGTNGNNGKNGRSGSVAASGGAVYKDSTTIVNANGGGAGAGGAAGEKGSDWNDKWDKVMRACAGGAGGGGGGGGYPGNGIGAGGTGGSQGGGGGGSGYVWGCRYTGGGGGGGGAGGNGGNGGKRGSDDKKGDDRDTNLYRHSTDGGCTAGGVGSDTETEQNSGSPTRRQGGNGGNGGGYGGNGAAGSVSSGTRLSGSYNVSFKKGSEPGGSVGDIVTPNYRFGISGQDIIPPIYRPGSGYYFVGWRVTRYADNLKGDGGPVCVNSTNYYRQGQNVPVAQYAIGNVEFTAITAEKKGLFDDSETQSIPALTNASGSPAAATNFYAYTITTKIDNVNNNVGNITIKDGSNTRSVNGNKGVYTYTSTNSGITSVTVAGKTVLLTNRMATVNFKTVKVKITGLTGYTRGSAGVKLIADGSAAAAPAMTVPGNDNSVLFVDQNTYSSTYVHSGDANGSYFIYVNGTNTGKTAAWGTTTTVDYNTVNVNPKFHGSINKDKVKRVELIDNENNSLILVGPDSTGNWYANRLADSTVNYTLYIDGLNTGLTTTFKDEGKTLTPDIYATDVYTKVDGTLRDVGDVRIGEESLARISAGTYQLISLASGSGTLGLGDRTFGVIEKGHNTTLNFYTITYEPNGASGDVTEDITLYPAGSVAELDYQGDLVNGGKTFDGWKINNGNTVKSTYEQRGSVTMNSKVTAKAVWKATDLSEETENFNVSMSSPEFTYNGRVQAPEITVKRGIRIHPGSDDDEVITLKEGVDYKLEYVNDNTAMDRNDTEGKSKDINSINAGNVSVTVVGINDYTGRIEGNSYTIDPAVLTARGLKAVGKEYDGSPEVVLNDSKVTYTGICSDKDDVRDDVKLKASGKGRCADPYAGRNKIVETGSISLDGAAASNYVLATTDPVYVDITTRDLSHVTFSVSDVTYNFSEQKPEVTFTDNMSVDGKIVNIISEDDLEIASAQTRYKIANGIPLTDEDDLGRFSYSNNINAGKATVSVNASPKPLGKSIPDGEEALPNYTGSKELTFTIKPAPLTIKPSEVTTGINDDDIDEYVKDKYSITNGTVYEDEGTGERAFEKGENGLGIKAVTEVKQDYPAGTYENAVGISYIRDNASNYDIRTLSADHVVKKNGSADPDQPSDDDLDKKIGFSDAAFMYDGADHSISVAVSSKVLDEVTVYYSETSSDNAKEIAEGTDASAKEAAKSPKVKRNAGTYEIFFYATSPSYLSPATGSAFLTIKKAPATVTAAAHTITYGEAVSNISESKLDNITITAVPDISGDAISAWNADGSITYDSSYRQYDDAGSYTLTPVLSDDLKGDLFKNYDVTCKPGTLTVEQKTISGFGWKRYASDESLSDNVISYVYNGRAQAPVALISEGQVVSADAGKVSVGTYTIEAASGSGLTDYKAVNKGSYTVKPAELAGEKAGNYKLAGSITAKGFAITRADGSDPENKNEWTTGLSINGWIAGQRANAPVAAARYGSPEFTYKPKDGSDDYSNTVPGGAGSYKVKATVDETDNYNGLVAEAEFTIMDPTVANKKIILVTPSAGLVYGSDLSTAAISLSYNTISGNSVRESTQEEIAKVSGTAVPSSSYDKDSSAYKNAGNYSLEVSGLTVGDDNYELVTGTGSLTVTPKPVSLKWEEKDATDNIELIYTGKAQSVTASTSDFLSGDAVRIGYSNTSEHVNEAAAVGSYTAKAVLDGSDAANYVINDGSDIREWSIAAGEINEVTVSMADWYYGEAAPDPVCKAKFGSPVFTYYTNEDCTDKTTVSGNGVEAEGGKPSRAGSYWVKAEVPANEADGWTNAASDKDEFVIRPAEITVKVADAKSKMGESLAALSYTVSVVHGVVSDGDGTKLQLTPVTAVTPTSVPGSYPITLDYADDFKGEDTDIKVSVLDGTYKILANDAQVITLSSEAADGNFVYDGNEHTITAPVVEDAVIQKAERLKYYYSTTQLTATNYGSGKPVLPSFKDVGVYTVYYYIAAPGWEAKAGSATITITKRPVLMSANNSTIVYGEAAADDGVTFGKTKEGNVEVQYSGLVDGDNGSEFNNISYTFVDDNSQSYGPGPENGKAGTYSIVPSLEDRNYSFTPVNGVMTVTKKALKADMFNDIEETTYTASANEVPVSVADSESSLLTPDQYVVEYSNNIDAGTATVTVKPSGTSNYSGEATKTFKINKKTVKLTADNKSSAQGASLNPLTYTVSEGVLSEAEKAALDIRLITTATDKSPAGEYPISLVYNAIAAKNYSITVANGTYTITGSLNMTVSTHPYSGVYDGEDHFRPVTVKTGIYDRTVTVYYSTQSQDDCNGKARNEKTEATSLNLRDAGNYTVYYTAVCNGFKDATGSFEVKISKKPLKINVPDATATYGDTGETVISGLSRADLTCEGLVGSETLQNLMGDEYDYITFTTDFNPADPEKKKAGNYKIGVEDFSENTGLRNYDITFADGKLTVNKKQVTFNWPDENTFTYNGSIHEYKVSEIVGVIGSDSVNAKYDNASARVIGNYTARVTGLTGEDADNYTVDGSAVSSHEWSITAPSHDDLIELTLEWPDETDSVMTYDGSVKTISANFIAASQEIIESQGDNSQDKLRIVLEGNSGTDTGDYTAKATLKGSSAPKYRIADGNEYHDWKIIPAVREVTLTWPSVSTYVYNGDERTVTASMSGVDDGDDVQLVYKEETSGSPVVTNKAVSAGNYKAVVTSLSGADAGKYSLPASGLEFYWSITKAGGEGGYDDGKNVFTSELTIAGWTYGDASVSPSASAKFGDVKFEYKEQTAGVEYYSTNVPEAPGVYNVRAKVDATDNYNGLTSEAIEFTIAKKPVTIIADDLSSMEGTDLKTLTWTPEVISWKVGNDVVSVSAIITDNIESDTELTGDAVKAAPGTYRIKLSAGGSNIDRYEFNLVHGYYFVTPEPVDINITATAYTGVYDGGAHGISVSVSGDDNARVYYALNELNEDNFLSEGSFESPTFTDAGDYEVYYYVYSEKGSVSENAIESGSAPIAGSKAVHIDKRPVLVTANDREMTYGDDPGADPAGVVYSKTRDNQGHDVAESGFVDPDTGISGSITPKYTYSYSQYGDVGEVYTITPSVEYAEGSKASNYDFVPNNGTLKVNKRPVTFEWNVNRFGYDGTEKVYTADVLNLVSDNRIEPVYSNEPGYTNTATEVGTYYSKITEISGDKAGNYIIADGALRESSFEIFKTDNSFTTDLSINGWTYGDTPNDPVCSAVYGSDNITYTYYTDEACTQMTGSDVAKGSAPEIGGKPVTPGTYYCVATIGAKRNATVSGNNYDMITSNAAAFTIKQVNLDIYASNMTADKGKVGTPTLKFSRQGSLVGGDEINVFLVTEANDSSEPGEYPITFRPEGEGGGVVIMAADGETDHTSCYNIKTTDAKFYITEEEGDQEGVTLKSSVSGALEGAESVIYDGLFHTLDVSVMKDGVKLDESDYSIYYGRDPQTGATPESLQAAVEAGNVTVSSPKLRQAGRQKVYYYVVYQNMVYSGTGTIIIEKKDLTLKPEYYECYVSDPMPLSPYNGISGEGFVNNETVRDLNAASAVYKCGYTGNYGIAGTYEITAEGFSSPNYDISYLPGTMLVKARIDISSVDCRISAMNRAYTGTQVATRIYVNGIELEKDVDFKVISGDFEGTDVEDYEFTIEGDEAYYGTRTLTWKITPASQARPEDGEGYTMTASDDDRVAITVVNTQEITYELFVFTEEGGSKVLKKVDNGSITVDEGTGLCIRKAAREPNYYASGFTEFIAKKEPKVNVSLIAQAKDTGKVTAYVNGKESASTSSSTSMILTAGTAFTLKAEPALGFEFDKWIKSDNTSSVYPEVRLSENSIPASDVIRDQSYTAVFKYSTSDTVSKVAGIPTVENPVPNIYTGSVITVSVNHVSDEDKDLYTMTGTEGINAGTYLAEATLKSDEYAWADGTREPKTYSWQIAKSPINELPGIIKDEDKKTITVMGGKGRYLSGQKYAYEYRKAGSTEWTDVPPNNVITDLEPNMSYYIRIKGTNNEEPSRAVVATLGETITVRTNPPTNVRATGAVLNGNAITGSLSANDLTYGFRYRKDGGAEYIDTAASVSGNSVSETLSGLDDNTRYSYYAYVRVNATGSEVRGNEVSFTTSDKASPVPTGNISIKVDTTDEEDMIPFVITVEFGNDVRMSAQGTTNTDSADLIAFTGLPYGNYNIVIRRVDGVEFTETRMLTIDSENSTVETVFTIPHGEIATVVNVEPGAPQIAVAGMPDIISQDEMDAAAEGSQSTKVELKVSSSDKESRTGIMLANTLDYGREIKELFDISLYKTVTQLNNEGEKTASETIDIGNNNNKVLEIAVPYEDLDETTVIYRVHEGNIQEFDRLSARAVNESGFRDGTYAVDLVNKYIYIYSSDFSDFAITAKARTPEYTARDNSDEEPGTAFLTFVPANPGKEIEVGYVTPDGFWHPLDEKYTIGPDGTTIVRGLPAGDIVLKVRIAETDFYGAGDWIEREVRIGAADPTKDFSEQVYVIHYIFEYNGKQLTRSTVPMSYTEVDTHIDDEGVKYYGISANNEFFEEAAGKLLKTGEKPKDSIVSYSILCKSVYSDGKPVLMADSSLAVKDMRIDINAEDFRDDRETGIAYRDIPYLYNDIYVYANVGAYATDKNADGVVITAPVGVKYSGLPHKLRNDPAALKKGAARKATYDLDIIIKDTKAGSDGYELVYGRDYTVTYERNTNASVIVSGSAGNAYYKQIYDEASAASKWPKITIMGKGNYKGMKSVLYFDILPISITESYESVGEHANTVKGSYTLKNKGGIKLTPAPARYARNYSKYIDSFVTNNSKQIKYRLGKDVTVELQKWDGAEKLWKRLGDITGTGSRKEVLSKVVNTGLYRVKVSGCGNYCGDEYDQFRVYAYKSVFFGSLKLKTATVKFNAGGVSANRLVKEISTKVKDASGNKVKIPASEYIVTLLPVSESARVSNDGLTALSAGKYKVHVSPKNAEELVAKYPDIVVNSDIVKTVTVKGGKLKKKMFGLSLSKEGSNVIGQPVDVVIDLNGIAPDDITLAKTVVKNGKSRIVPLTGEEENTAVTVSGNRLIVKGSYELSDGRRVDNSQAGTYRLTMYGRRGYADSVFTLKYKRAANRLSTGSLSANSAPFNAGGAMTDITVTLPDGSKETVSGTGNANFKISYKKNKAVGNAIATVTAKNSKRGYKKGSKANIGFKIDPMIVSEIHPYSDFTNDKPGELFILTPHTVKAGKKASFKIYQSSWNGKKLVAVSNKLYTGTYEASGSLANTYDLVLKSNGKAYDFTGGSITVEEAYTGYTRKAGKWTGKKSLKLSDMAALIQNANDSRSYTSDDIAVYGISEIPVMQGGNGVYRAKYAGNCYILPTIPELTVDGHELKLADGDYTISYKNNDRLGTAEVIVKLSQKTAREYGIGGSKTYTFKIVKQSDARLTL